ncbi:MAG: class I SAM-dependent methyltransferase, partial [Chloroflexota bacterium]|nr:class I SAM-dependent methyltransferase [Chloroflexota bacterium]
MDQVDELNLREIYNAEYYEKDAKRYVVPSTKSRANWVRRLHLLEKCQQQTNRGKILDVGCGPGVFLEVAQRGGWDVCGIDMSPEAVFEAGGRIGADRVSNIDLLSLDTTEQYDAITM